MLYMSTCYTQILIKRQGWALYMGACYTRINTVAIWHQQRIGFVAEWSVSILDKGLQVNVRNSKVMVGSSSGWKMIVNFVKCPCAVCGDLV